MFKALLTSQSFLYVFLRYFTYILAFVNTLLLARFLGGYEYGIYSFILLVTSYMTYSNLGINESLNTEYAKYKHRAIANKIWDNAWSLNIIVSGVAFLIFYVIYLNDNNLFYEYSFGKYAVAVILTCAITNLSRIYITFYKLHGKLIKLNVQQLLPNIAVILLVFIYKYRVTNTQIVWVLFGTNLISLIVFRIGLPIKPRFFLSWKLTKILLVRGISLLIYNFSFYLFILLASSIISINYTVLEFGCFSLSNSLANGIIMAGGAFLFIFYPRILHSMSKSKIECYEMIRKIKSIYVVGINIICLLSIPVVYILSFFYPQYSVFLVKIFGILMVGKCINNATTGYSAYLIANKKENLMTIYALISVIIEYGIIKLFLNLNLQVEYVTLAIVVGSLVYAALIVSKGVKCLHGFCSFYHLIKELLDNGNWFVLIVVLIYSLVWSNMYFLGISLCAFYLLYHKQINTSLSKGLNIIKNKNAINF